MGTVNLLTPGYELLVEHNVGKDYQEFHYTADMSASSGIRPKPFKAKIAACALACFLLPQTTAG